MQKFSNMPLSEVASAAVPAARRVAVPTAKPASLSAEALNIPRSGIRVFCFNVCSTGSAVFFRSVG